MDAVDAEAEVDDKDGSSKPGYQSASKSGPSTFEARAMPWETQPAVAEGVSWPELPRRFDALVLALQMQFNASQWWQPEQLLAHQLGQVQRLIRHAARTVPFYCNRLAPLRNLVPEELTIERFRSIPLLTRRDIQEAGEDLLSRDLPNGHGEPRPEHTSGSSGQPIMFMSTTITAVMRSALTLRGHMWHNRDLSQKNVRVRAKVKTGHRSRWMAVPWSGANVDLSGRLSINEMFDHIIDEDPAYLEAHPNQIAGLLQRTIETGMRPKNLREARTFGENLDPWLREKCRSVWGVPIVDNYSAEEFGTIAHQCPESTNLHVMAENVLVEVLDENNEPCQRDEAGRVVVTSLNNFATPLIREDLGDIAEVGGPCVCGRGLPVLTRILGRERNLIVRPNGERVLSATFREMTDLTPVRQFQLTQKTLELIEVKLAATRPLTEDEEEIIRKFIHRVFGYAFDLRFVYVDEIPREPSGKYQDCRSEVSASRVDSATI